MKRPLQAVAPSTEQPLRYSDRVYLTFEEAAARIGLRGAHPGEAFRKFAARHELPICGLGRVKRIETRVLDAYMRGEDWTLRRRGVRHVRSVA